MQGRCKDGRRWYNNLGNTKIHGIAGGGGCIPSIPNGGTAPDVHRDLCHLLNHKKCTSTETPLALYYINVYVSILQQMILKLT